MINHLLVVFLTICGVCTQFNDKKVKDGQFKYVVSIWHRDEYKCSGAIISERHILTTAFWVNYASTSTLTVIAGTIETNDPTRQIYLVESIHTHYGYEPDLNTINSDEIEWVNDIAILELVHEIIWNPHVEPINLITEEYNSDSLHNCVVPGWKDTGIPGQLNNMELRWIEAEIELHDNAAHRRENEEYAHFYTRNLPSLSEKSGSPIVCDGIAVGIIITEKPTKNPKRLLNIIPYLDFINNAIDMEKKDVHCGEITHAVSIWESNTFVCSGTVLTDLHILTTAGCLWHLQNIDLRVIAGRTQLLPSDQRIEQLLVNKITIDSCLGDIAILTLAASLIFNPTISQAVFAETSHIPIQRMCKSYRWQRTYAVNGETLIQLVWVPIIIMDAAECMRSGVNLGVYQFCARDAHSHSNSNIEKIGSAIICDDTIFGIMIPRDLTQATPSNFSIFFAISPYKEMITAVVSENVE